MPPVSKPKTDTKIMIDRSKNAILLARTFAAPRQQIFEAWTQPEQISIWWDPSGAPLALCEIDLRPGGAFKFVNQGHANVPPLAGVYRHISPPEKLVFEAMGAIGEVIFEDVQGTTRMTVSIACSSPAHLDQFLQMGVDVGTSQTLDNLVSYIGR